MMKHVWGVIVSAAILPLSVACAAPVAETATMPREGMMATSVETPSATAAEAIVALPEATDEAMSDRETAEGEPVASDGQSDGMEATVELAAWQTLPLVDARSGATFTLADFLGKTVYVEPMATWCTNCRRQLREIAAARPQFGEDVVFVALSVETALTAQQLAAYADSNGFDWTFAVATPELLIALADTFGQTITNPPATPHFVIRPDGSYGSLHTGITSASALPDLIASN